MISPKRSTNNFVWKANPYRLSILLTVDLAFNHSFCLRDVAWIRPAYSSTKRADVGATSPSVLVRQWPLPKQSKHQFASWQHHILIIAQAWKACSWTHFKKNPSIRDSRWYVQRAKKLNEVAFGSEITDPWSNRLPKREIGPGMGWIEACRDTDGNKLEFHEVLKKSGE